MNEDLLKLIDASFLQEKEKVYLVQFLEVNGPSDQFYTQFNSLLIGALKKKEKSYSHVMEGFEESVRELDEQIGQEKDKLEQEAELKLSKTTVLQPEERDKAWKAYYDGLEKIRHGYEERLKAILSRSFAAVM